MRRTRKLLNSASGEQKDLLRSNIEANQFTIDVVKSYSQYLQNQQAQYKENLAQTRKKLQVAENTYSTVKLSMQVLSLIRESQRDFKALSDLQLPKTLVFDNSKIEQEFIALTAKLQQAN